MPPYDPDRSQFPILEADPELGYNDDAYEHIPYYEFRYSLPDLPAENDCLGSYMFY